MSFSIIYNRAFVLMPDGRFIPMINSGSSNASDFVHGREVCEKSWGVPRGKRSLPFPENKELRYTEAEIMELARSFEEVAKDGIVQKSRYKPFRPGEITRFFINGMKHSHTVEEWDSAGNRLYLTLPGGVNVCVRDTACLVGLLDNGISQSRAEEFFELAFENDRKLFPVKNMTTHEISGPVLATLKGSRNKYVSAVTAYGVSYSICPMDAMVFDSEQEARKAIFFPISCVSAKIKEADKRKTWAIQMDDTKLFLSSLSRSAIKVNQNKKMARRFPSEEAAEKWLMKYDVNTRFNHVYTPIKISL